MKFKLRQLSIIVALLGIVLLAVSFFLVTEKNEVGFSYISPPHTDSRCSPEPEHYCPNNVGLPSVSFNDKPNHEKSRQLRFELERDGAWAEVDCRVSDRFGNPVPEAEIHFYFDVKEGQNETEGIVEGKTDCGGRFFAKHKTTYACHWRIRKDGFYEARGILPFSNHFSWEQGKKRRWNAESLHLDVVLDEKSGATLFHGEIYWKHLVFPTNAVVWFDFETGDCVEPYGKGKNKHISFYSEGLADPRIGFRSGIAWTNLFVVAAPEGGLVLLKENRESSMPFVHDAPEEFSNQKLDFIYARSHKKTYVDTRPKAGEYIVFRTSCDSPCEGEPHYGVIRNMECWPGGLRMEWFFNPKPGDRRIDADITSPLDFKR